MPESIQQAFDFAESAPESPFPKSMELFRRAAAVIPCGIYGHQSPAACLPGASPYFAERASGCHFWDVDGHQYLDFMAAYGPVLLGYREPEVEAAAEAQARDGDTMNHPSARFVELAEALVERVDFATWAVFGKNGGDVTSWAVRVAREATRRKKIIRLKGGYHGVDAWCNPYPGGLIEEDRTHIHTFGWNQLDQLQDRINRYRDQVAGVIITPFHHPGFADCAMPEPGFLQGVQALCREHGILLILDDIRAGFRLHRGGSHRVFDFQPDLICFSKALGNGFPISAALGTQALRLPASRVFLTGSFWNSAVPMAAALTVLRLIDQRSIPQHLEALGLRLRRGLLTLGEKHGLPIVASGPPAAPFYRFAHETNFRDWQRFCALAMRGDGHTGAFFHPHHNWFISAAHTDATIDQALTIADHALGKVRGQ